METWPVFALLSAVFAALVAIFGKLGVSKVDTTLATTVRSIIMAVFLVLLALILGKFNDLNTIDNRAWLFIALSGIAGALSWLAYFVALKLGPPIGVVAFDRLSIAFVVIFSVLFLAQKLTPGTVIGTVLMIVGAILLSR